jgi:ATP phosphoribosyltransferase regulatory subunit
VPGREEELFDLLQAKDVPELKRMLADVAEPARSALLALPELYGGPEVLDEAAARLPQDAEIGRLLGELRQLAAALADLPVSFDLADLRGYNYHSGVVFAAYGAESPAALALGGRYDRVGEAFGRARPAVGFSLDLRELVWRLPTTSTMAGAVLAPPGDDAALAVEVAALRARGEIVLSALPGHEGTWNEAGCDRQLVKRGDRWAVVPLQGE